MYSKIVSTGSYLPKKVRTNKELESLFGCSDEWIMQRTGIRSRHIADGETVSFMAYQAGLKALEFAHLNPCDIDLIIVATTSSESAFPSSACLVQKMLGIENAISFDIAAACSGFIYALATADNFIKSGNVKRALVIGSDALSHFLDLKDRSTSILFGDGAGAVILEKSDKKGIITTKLVSKPDEANILSLQNSSNSSHTSYIKMQGSETFKIAVKMLSKIAKDTLLDQNLTADDIDYVIPHQANIRILQAVAKKLGISLDKFILTLEEQGNTSAASIPCALDKAIRDGRIVRDNMLLLETFGGGLTWGSALIKY